jgi:hypothetical protein
VRKIDLLITRSEVEHARVVQELLKTNPALDRGLLQVLEKVRRQLDVAPPAIRFEDTVGGGGLSVQETKFREKQGEQDGSVGSCQIRVGKHRRSVLNSTTIGNVAVHAIASQLYFALT